ncbi:uncharacterized protein LOC104266555 [Ciona intestinalis]
MYDGGNEVQVLNGSDAVTVTYGFNDTFGNDEYQAANIPGHPFQLGIWISNERQTLNTLQIRVTSNFGADGSGSETTQSGNVELGNFQITYKARQIYNAGDPSVLEVYYVVNNTQQWSSNTDWSFTLTVGISGTQNDQNTAMLSSMSNVFFGYTLLSARNGRFTSDTELAAVMREYLQIIAGIPAFRFQVQQSLSAISSYSEQITCQVPNFYKYNYDSVNQISDGGFDMYDGGNQIYFGKGQQLVRASYNQTSNFPDYTFSTLATYPFTALMRVNGNTDGQNYNIEVRSNAGADGSGITARNSGWLYPNGYVIHFESFQIYGTQDPTICEVYFQIENNAWGSNFRSRVILQILGNNQDNVRNHASISSTSRAMFGYMLLSKRDVRGDLITENEIRNSLYEMVNLIAGPGHNLPTPFPMLPKPNVDSSTTAIPATTTVDQQTTAATTTTNFANVQAIILALNASSDVITASLPNFHTYTYDGPSTSISDGGSDMYDGGNEIQVLNGTGSVLVNYGFSNTFGNDEYQAANIPGHPFQLGIWVGNERRTLNTLQIRVTSDFGADGSGAETTQSGNVELGNFRLTYKARQIYNAGDPSVLEVYYVVNNTQQWSSNTDWSFTLTVGISGTARDQNTAMLNSMSNVFFGYTLLSARNGRFTSDTELAAVMREYLQIISSIPETSGYVERSVQAISNFKQQITNQVPEFYNYLYDSVDQISDGGNDMYDGGNQIYFGQGQTLQRVAYNQTYRLSGHSFATLAIHPFTALMWVTGNGRSDNYTIEVRSNLGSDGNGQLTRFSGSLNLNNYLVMYRTFQVHGASDPTVCEVFFLISSPTVLQSSSNPLLDLEVTSTNQNGLINRANVPGSTRNTMFGYLLLSRENGKFIPELVVRNTLYEATNLIMGPGFGLTTPFPPLPLPNNNTTPSSTTATVTESPATTTASTSHPQVQQSLSAISNYSEQITCQVPNFYKYNYDSVNQISDGGFDMYDGGNQIYFGKGSQLFRASYNQTSNFPDYTFSTLATYPFTALMRVNGNTDGQNYTIEVRSDAGSDGSGITARKSGWLYPIGYWVHFESFQIYGTQDPTICEVYFQIEHSTWGSNFRSRVILQILGNGQNNLRNHASVSSTSRAMFGYMLLSKRGVGGDLITEDEISNSLYEMVNLIAGPGHNLPTPFPTLPKPNVDSFTTAFPATTTVDQQTTATTTVHPQVQQSLSAISSYSEQITCQVPNFYKYNYDSVNQISDGGFDMYDGGNQIYFGKGQQLIQASYNQTSNFGDYTFSTLATYPFTALMWIDGNTNGQNYTIEVRSDTGADGAGITARNSGWLFPNGYVIHFESFQIYGTQDPTICEVYFQIEHYTWRSNFRSRVILQILGVDQNNVRNHASISSTSRAMFGYMLLSKRDVRGDLITENEIRNSLYEMVNLIAGPGHNLPTPFPTLPKPNVDSSTTAIPATTTVDQQTTTATTVHPQVQQSLSAISNYSEQITCQVPNFYKYNYDSVNQISDGGFDMYDGGNQIYFGKGSQLNRADYNQTSNFGDYTFSTLATYPFTALMWIDGNTNGQNYTIEVRSNTGADGFGRTARNSGSLFQNGYSIHFESFQIYGTQDPTICEVYFQIESFFWQSSFRSRIILQILSNNQDSLRNHASISSTSRAMFGYMLLSKTTGIVTNSEIQNALQQTVNIIAGPGHNQPTPFPFLPKPTEPQTTAATSTQPPTTPLPTTPPTTTPPPVAG